MALNKAALATLMKAKIEEIYGRPAEDQAMLQGFCDAIADAVVTHIQAAAQVSVSGVQSGGATVTGTVS